MLFSVCKCLICGFAVFYHFIKFWQELFKIVLTLLNNSHCLISFLFSALKGLFKSKNIYEKHQFSLNNRFIWNFYILWCISLPWKLTRICLHNCRRHWKEINVHISVSNFIQSWISFRLSRRWLQKNKAMNKLKAKHKFHLIYIYLQILNAGPPEW